MPENPQIAITFDYIHCSKKEIESKEASFVESAFYSELTKAFITQLKIQSVSVEITHNAAQSTNNYTCMIHTMGPQTDFVVDQKGLDAASITRDCIHKTLNQIHILKEKHIP